MITEIPYQVPKAQADRADRRPDRRQEAADPRRRPRRIRRGDPHRARAAQPHRRSEMLMDSLFRLTDLEVRVPLNLNVLDAQPHAAGDEPASEVLVALARAPDRRARPPLAAPARQDRRPARAARRLSHRLPQPRPGDRDHPHRGRAQAGDDRRVRADRPPGRGDPQHAAALACASSRKCSSAASATTLLQGARGARQADRIARRASAPGSRRISPRCASATGRRPRSAARRTSIEEAGPAREIPLEAMIEREPITVIMSKRGWIRAMKGHVELASPRR